MDILAKQMILNYLESAISKYGKITLEDLYLIIKEGIKNRPLKVVEK